jgi:hypothetical protein
VIGDKSGRIIIFKYQKLPNSRYFDYKYFTEIQSAELEFDQLKSIVKNKEINEVRFLNTSNPQTVQLLASGSASIKLWRIT